MSDWIRRVVGEYLTPPPIPPEAFPPGLAGRLPAARTSMQVAWDQMFYHSLTTGICIGALAVLAIVVAIVFRMNLRSTLKEAAVDAFRS